MAKFEIELPDEVAETLRTADRRFIGGPLEVAIAALPVLHDQSHQYPRQLEDEDLEVIGKLFVSLGRFLDRQATGAHRCFVSVEEREKRSEKARRAHATRKARAGDTSADVEPTSSQPVKPQPRPSKASNVVTLFPGRKG